MKNHKAVKPINNFAKRHSSLSKSQESFIAMGADFLFLLIGIALCFWTVNAAIRNWGSILNNNQSSFNRFLDGLKVSTNNYIQSIKEIIR